MINNSDETLGHQSVINNKFRSNNQQSTTAPIEFDNNNLLIINNYIIPQSQGQQLK